VADDELLPLILGKAGANLTSSGHGKGEKDVGGHFDRTAEMMDFERELADAADILLADSGHGTFNPALIMLEMMMQPQISNKNPQPGLGSRLGTRGSHI